MNTRLIELLHAADWHLAHEQELLHAPPGDISLIETANALDIGICEGRGTPETIAARDEAARLAWGPQANEALEQLRIDREDLVKRVGGGS